MSNTASKSTATAPVYVASAGNEGSYIQTSPDVAHPVTTDEDAINNILNYLPDPHAASNSNLLFYSLNRSILSPGGDLTQVQSTIKNYTDSFLGPNQSTNWVTPPSAQFLTDLKAIGDTATSGDVTAATSALAKASGEGTGSVATATTRAQVALLTNENMREGLKMEGYSASDATAQADAITIGGLVGRTGNAAKDKAGSTEISDLARELTLEAFSPDSKTAQSSYVALANIVNTLLGATSTDAANSSLASLDKVYG
ncbi:hypothetical protein HDF16_006002 [Granulicella aggregans]|uniref:Uncharacterized protein n=2 Tax=Granulicella aggregans TaxID=474949 RepID=A0A7W7ZJW4_9BACT|nr:hypothetical protein [Granulicella aggregans]MBB5061266.1 hypothetical protein [Granulicella aggregans]